MQFRGHGGQRARHGAGRVQRRARREGEAGGRGEADEDAGRAKLKELTKAGRYQRDVY